MKKVLVLIAVLFIVIFTASMEVNASFDVGYEEVIEDVLINEDSVELIHPDEVFIRINHQIYLNQLGTEISYEIKSLSHHRYHNKRIGGD